MKVLIYGATGIIGGSITREALQRGHDVTAVVRDPARVQLDEARVQIALGDVLDEASLSALARGQEAILSAVGAGIHGPHPRYDIYRQAARSLIGALRALDHDAPRLLVVGGAGSLEVAGGARLVDTPQFPEMFHEEALAQIAALEFYRSVTDVSWTYISPAALVEPGERTGRYRSGGDQLMLDDSGTSRVSTEDYAAAFIDELKNAHAIRRRISVAY